MSRCMFEQVHVCVDFVQMCLCLVRCVHVYTCRHVFMDPCVWFPRTVPVYLCAHACMLASAHSLMLVGTHARSHTCVSVHLCSTCARTCVLCTHVGMSAMFRHTCMCICSHTCACVHASLLGITSLLKPGPVPSPRPHLSLSVCLVSQLRAHGGGSAERGDHSAPQSASVGSRAEVRLPRSLDCLACLGCAPWVPSSRPRCARSQPFPRLMPRFSGIFSLSPISGRLTPPAGPQTPIAPRPGAHYLHLL